MMAARLITLDLLDARFGLDWRVSHAPATLKGP